MNQRNHIVTDTRSKFSVIIKRNKALALLRPSLNASKRRYPVARSIKNRRLVKALQIPANVQPTAGACGAGGVQDKPWSRIKIPCRITV
jgi:hypothetical protein